MKPLSKPDAEAIIARVCRNEIGLAYSSHFWVRVEKRFPSLTSMHVIQVLRTGDIVDGPVKDDSHNSYRIKIQASLPELGKVKLVVGIATNRDATCITVF